MIKICGWNGTRTFFVRRRSNHLTQTNLPFFCKHQFQTKFHVISKFLLRPIFLHLIKICSSLPIFKPKIFQKKLTILVFLDAAFSKPSKMRCKNEFLSALLIFDIPRLSLWVMRTKLRYGFVIKCFVTTLTVFITARSSKSSTVWVSGKSESSYPQRTTRNASHFMRK